MKAIMNEMAKVIGGPGSSMAGERSMGALLIDAGRISPEDAERILRQSKEKGVRFGDAAIGLGLVTPADVQEVLARQFAYPYLRPGESAVSKAVVAAWSPFSEQVESLRALRSQLLLRWITGEGDRKALAVVSPNAGDGRSFVASNLAVVFSQMGEKTLLIDADLRSPVQHDLFGLKNSVGLSTVLAERVALDAIQRVPAFVDLSVLPAGPIPPNPLELVGKDGFARLLREVSETFDVVIIDTPSVKHGSEYQFVAKRAGAAVCVARLHRTTNREGHALAEAIQSAGATLVGGVLNEH